MPSTRPPRPGSTSSLREANARRILEALRGAQRSSAGLSQAQLARETNLAPATVSGIVRSLSEAGLLDVEHGAGRRGALVSIGRRAGLVAGVDFGHSHLTVAVADLAGHILAQHRSSLAADHAADEGLDLAGRLLDQALSEISSDRSQIRRVGLGLPAPLSHGVVQSPGILPGWIGLKAAQIAEEALGAPVDADNDANFAAVAEFRRGQDHGDDSLVFVKLSSGLGAGIILQGNLIHGVSGMAGELGHVTIDEDGPFCRCGNRGCLETYVSVPHVLSALASALPGTSFTEVVEGARHGNPAAARALEDVGHRLGEAMAAIVNLLDPGTILVGGEMATAGDLVLEPLRTSLRRHCLDPMSAQVRVAVSEFGEDASVIGAIEIALDNAVVLD